MGDGVVTSMRGPGRPRGPLWFLPASPPTYQLFWCGIPSLRRPTCFQGREVGWQLVGSFLAQETTSAWLLLGR